MASDQAGQRDSAGDESVVDAVGECGKQGPQKSGRNHP